MSQNTDLRLISVYFYLILIEILTAQAFKNFNDICSQTNTSAINVDEECQPWLVCHQHRCKCPAGSGYSDFSGMCIDFNSYPCTEDHDCNGVDGQRWCNPNTRRCECNRLNGFYETRDTKLCKSRHPLLNQTCDTDNDCDVDYSYCKNSLCECWPEFETQVDHLRSTAGKIIVAHHCVRKICLFNTNCQTVDNPNLICNNTICECEHGYSVDSHRVCVKLSRRQNCNITCQIIGGLFASIFMLSLIYWCFYCCYSIVKNYKMHNRSRNCVNNNHMIEETPQMQRFIRRQSNVGIQINPNDQSFVNNNTDDRYYCYDHETPPNYSQISDEPPDYESVVHMKANE